MTTPGTTSGAQRGGRSSAERALVRELAQLNKNLNYITMQMRRAQTAGGAGAAANPFAAAAAAGGGGAQTAAGGAGGAAAATAAKKGIGAMLKGALGGPVGMGLAALQLIELPIIMMSLFGSSGKAKEGVSGLNTAIGGLQQSALSASDAVAKIVISLRHVTAEVGTNVRELMTVTSAYSAVGSENPLGDAQAFARRFGGLRRGLAAGSPDPSYLLGAGMLGLDPMAIRRQTPSQYQRSIVERLRGMSAGQRESDFTRAALERMVGSEDMADILRLANMSPERYNRFSQRQSELERSYAGFLPGLTEWSENVTAVQSHRQMRADAHKMRIEYLRRGGGTQPLMAEFKSEMARGGETISEMFWQEMSYTVKVFREMFGSLSESGKMLSTIFEAIGGAGQVVAELLSIIAGVIVGAIATIKLALDGFFGILDTLQMISAASTGDMQAVGNLWNGMAVRSGETAELFSASGRLLLGGVLSTEHPDMPQPTAPGGGGGGMDTRIHIDVGPWAPQIVRVGQEDLQQRGLNPPQRRTPGGQPAP